MATAPLHHAVRQLRQALLRRDGAGRTDGQLLDSFVRHRDGAAFEALVRRHGPMVLGVCRRVVQNYHDAEDAFQATFLVLARKAPSVRPPERVGDWLHGVAYRTALKARAVAARRRQRERQVADLPEPEATPQEPWDDLPSLLDRELSHLPEAYRLPILLCGLEGRSIQEAARQLGWPQGTLAGRLARGRKMLALRLARRGLVLSAASLAAVLGQATASAGVPASLVSSTARLVGERAAGQAGAVPTRIAALTEEVLKAMVMKKLQAVTAVLLMAMMVGVGGGWLSRPATAAGRLPRPAAERAGDGPRAEGPARKHPLPRPAPAERERVYQIHFDVAEAADGGERRLAGPTISVPEGQEGRCFIVTGAAASGLDLSAKVTEREAGRLRLDVRVERTEPEEAEGDELRVAGASLHVVKTLRPGETVNLGVTDATGRTTRFQLTVRRADDAGGVPLPLSRVPPPEPAVSRPGQDDARFPDGRAHDFGRVRRGTRLRHVFRIVNTSEIALRLTSVRSSAGCLTGSVDQEVLRPREAARLEVAVDTGRFAGAKTMTLYLIAEHGTTTETLTFSLTAHSDEGPPR